MENRINDCVQIYKDMLVQGNIQIAYESLLKFIWSLKSQFERDNPAYACGSISPGYLDYSYFPFFNAYLRENKLRFGIVLNHAEMRFELWLMGQNAKIQEQYWNMLKNTHWNEGREKMPRYSVLEVVLADAPDFNALDKASEQIIGNAIDNATDIIAYLTEHGGD